MSFALCRKSACPSLIRGLPSCQPPPQGERGPSASLPETSATAVVGVGGELRPAAWKGGPPGLPLGRLDRDTPQGFVRPLEASSAHGAREEPRREGGRPGCSSQAAGRVVPCLTGPRFYRSA